MLCSSTRKRRGPDAAASRSLAGLAQGDWRRRHLVQSGGHGIDADVSRGGPHRHRLALSGRSRRAARAGRLRHVPGAEGAAAAQLGRPPVPPASIDAVVLTHAHLDHVGHAAAARGAGLQRSHLLHAGHAGPVLARAARRRTPAGGGSASAPTAAATRSTRRPCRSSPRSRRSRRCRGCSRSGMNAPCRSARGLEVGVHPRRPPARLRLRPDAPGRRHRRHACSSAATWAATTGRSCRTRRPASAADVLLLESTYGDRVHPDDDEDDGSAAIINETAAKRRQAHHSGVCDRAGRGSALLPSSGSKTPGRCRRCRSTSTVRWRSRR